LANAVNCNMHEVFGKDRQCRFKSNSSEDETLLLETRTVHIFCEHLSRGDESARHPKRSTYVKRKEILSMPAQRFGERQDISEFFIKKAQPLF
jgi:hypothetical protein